MQKEKILQKTFFVAVAAVNLVAVPAVVKADDAATVATPAIPATSITVDGSKGLLTVSSTAKEVLVGTGKANVKKATITVSKWDVYEPKENKVNVDLSKLKNTTDNYLVLSTSTDESKISIVKIPVAAKYTKVKYDAKTESLEASYGDSAKNAKTVTLAGGTTASGDQAAANDADIAKFQYRTTYSGWEFFATVKPDLALYQENGAQLYVRLKAGATATDTTTSGSQVTKGTETLTYDNGQEDLKVPVFDAQSLPGKESKVTIAAKAKGPSVTANFTTGMIKLPKNTEYRIVQANDAGFKPDKEATPVSKDGNEYEYGQSPTDKKEYSADEVFVKAGITLPTDPSQTLTAVLEVRKPKGKKAASKWSRVKIQTLEKLGGAVTVGAVDKTKKGADKKPAANVTEEFKGSGISGSKVQEGDKDVIAVTYSSSGTKTKTYSVAVENKSTTYSYEIATCISGSGSRTQDVLDKAPDAMPEKYKITKVSAARSADKSVVKKISKVDEWSPVWIRRAGDKKSQQWATDWAYLGTVDYPYDAPTTAGSGSGGTEEKKP